MFLKRVKVFLHIYDTIQFPIDLQFVTLASNERDEISASLQKYINKSVKYCKESDACSKFSRQS